jgi:alpha-tubulin suppressor-like RCC1 family protein
MKFQPSTLCRIFSGISDQSARFALALIGATGLAMGPARGDDLSFSYNSPADVPVVASSFTATGMATLALNFAPAVGTNLKVIDNTGLDFISGTFSNLAQGQEVVLSYGGLPYRFWVNYFGGTGNDLVLQWAKVRPMSWGNNFNGQLGSSGALGTSKVPVVVSQNTVLANKTVTAVASGYGHSVVLCSDGTLATWGWNDYGQLGNATGPSKFNPTPVAVRQSGVLAGKTVIAVSAGGLHTVVLCSDGTLAAWGDNGYGQLGNNSNTDSNVPVAVLRSGTLAGKTFVAVAAGYHHNLALCSDGTLAAWGWNADGQLGINSKTNSTVPVPVYQDGTLAGRSIVAMSAGIGHSLVLCSDGTLAAWGDNSYGQLGNNDNSRTGKLTPVPVDRSGLLAGKTITAVTAGFSHNLAMCSDGTLATWGWNKDGQLGNNTTTDSSVPVAVSTSGVLAGKLPTAISAGYGHNLALCSDGTLAAWGYNPAGQLGNNTSIGSTAPVAVTTSGLAAGERFFLARSGQSASSNLALVATPATKPASVIVSSGSDQLAEVNMPFGRPLEVLVRDQSLQPLSGVTVTFNKPGSGASGSFAGGVNTAVTNASGIAVSPVFSANTVAVGPYAVSAGVPGGLAASFILTNLPAAASQFEIGTPTVATAGASIGITVTARDQFNNRATGFSRTVRFTSTDDGATLPADYTFMAAEAGFHRFTGGVKLIKAGLQSLTVTDTENPSITGTGSISVSAGTPASMVATSGTPQVAKVNTAFALPLVAGVHDAFGNPVAGRSVTFTTPGSGPSATIGGNASITIVTDPNGLASSGMVTANAENGSYIVTATVPGVASPAGFALGNGTQNPTPTMPPTPSGGFRASSQTGLFDLTVPVRNTTPLPINGFRLHVNLSAYLTTNPSLRLYSASSPAGSPDVYVDYPYPVAVGGVVSMKLSFYTSTRTFPKPFAPGLSVEMLGSSQIADTNGSGVQPRLVSLKDGAILLEFPSVVGHWYRVRYSENMIDWRDCPIALQASGSRTQWIDRGPPFTIVPPSAAPSRFYVVNKIKTP